jgi:HAE1 family hydrophobic/amphiphilic exporter-1
VIGGLITSTLLTLLVVPAMFSLVEDIERWAGPRMMRLIGAQGAAAPEDPAVNDPRGA